MASNSTALGFPAIPPNIAALTAPQLMGTPLNWALFGVLSVQTYIYYLNFPEDSIRNKTLVYGAYMFETAQTAMTAADLYFWFSSGFGNLLHLGHVNVAPVDTPLLCGIIAAVVQSFFAYRIYTLRKSYWIICVVILLAAAIQTTGAIAASVQGFRLQEFSRFHENVLMTSSFYIWFIGDIVCDILIAGTMIWLLSTSHKENIAQGGDNQILGRLVRLIIQTNALTAAMAVLSFICYAVFPEDNLFVCTTLVMGKLYSNTLLVTFNNRIALRSNLSKGTSYESGGSARLPVRRPNSLNNRGVNTFNIAVESFSMRSKDAEPYKIEIGRSEEHAI